MGSVFKRGNTYWIKYYRNGKPFRESAKTDRETEARKLLKLREGQIAEGKFPGLRVEKVTFEELAQDFINDYQINGKKSLDKAERNVKYLSKFFGGMRAINVTTDQVNKYIAQRKETGYLNSSINRELAALKRMFNMAAKQDPPKVIRVPYIPTLKERNIRTGFFEYEEYITLRANLPEYLRPVTTLAYYTGWRKEEILSLTWDRVDLVREVIWLDPGTTKNDDGKVFILEGELLDALTKQKEIRDIHYPDCPYVFFINGRKIRDFRKAWYTACKKAGVSGKVLHDFRRTAARDMVRAGIPERVAMTITGHKTRSVFERYNIVSQNDLREAAYKRSEYVKKMTGTNSGTIETAEKIIESLQSGTKPLP